MASEQLARTAMQGEEQQGKKRRIDESSKDLLCEDCVNVQINGVYMRMLWSVTSRDVWVEMLELWLTGSIYMSNLLLT